MSETECREHLGLSSVGRIGLSMDALPAIFPVNYIVDGDSVVFRAAIGTRLAEASNRGVVAFESGYIDPGGLGGWSVLAVGIPCETGDPADRLQLALHHPAAWSRTGQDRFFRLAIDMISGTRVLSGAGGNPRSAA